MGIFLETERLILKTTEISDLDNLIALRGDPDVMKYIGKDGVIQTIDEVKNFATTNDQKTWETSETVSVEEPEDDEKESTEEEDSDSAEECSEVELESDSEGES